MNFTPPTTRRKTRQRGASIVVFTMLMAFVILPLVGLAVDGSIIFWGKAKLSAAVDAAALAGGRYVNVSNTTSQNTGTVVTIAQEWFAANFPTGWLGSTVANGGPTVTYVTTSSSTQQVTVSATATIPLYFLRLIGQSTATISASAQSSRRNSFIVLILDRSGSMGSGALGSNACPTMQQDAIQFVNMFTENFDTMALVTFSGTAGPSPDFGPSQSFKSGMTQTINSIACTGATSTAQALQMAYRAIQAQNFAGGLNVIVLFTDGQPNELVASYPIKTATDNRYGIYPPYFNYFPYTTTYSWGPSPCNTGSSSLVGGMSTALMPPIENNPAAQGVTVGIFDTSTQIGVSTSPGYISGPGCYFSQGGGWEAFIRLDVAYIPTQDSYGNLTNAGYGGNSPYYGPGVGTTNLPDTFTTGSYAGQIRPDEQTIGIMAAAINAADYQAQVIRSDTTYNPIIYTIGLGGAADMPVDDVFLERVANDPRSPIYNSAQKTGMYVPAPTASQLSQAFQLVAGQILRLSQ